MYRFASKVSRTYNYEDVIDGLQVLLKEQKLPSEPNPVAAREKQKKAEGKAQRKATKLVVTLDHAKKKAKNTGLVSPNLDDDV